MTKQDEELSQHHLMDLARLIMKSSGKRRSESTSWKDESQVTFYVCLG